MASSKAEAKKLFPLPVYNYKLRIGDETHGFSEVSGLNLQYDTITYRHGLSALEGAEYLPGLKQPVNVSLKRGVVAKGSLLWDWIKTIKLDFVEKRDITIDLCDDEGHPVVSWAVINAWPTKMDMPSFAADTNEVALESMDLIAQDLLISYH